MSPECQFTVTARREANELPFREGFCLPFLLRAQNPDGGWGYHPEARSSVEPSASAMLALREEAGAGPEPVARGIQWLHQAQLAEGAWPTEEGQPGCWVTALACLALIERQKAPDAGILKGLQWLVNSWPAEGNFWWRLRQRRAAKSQIVVRQDHSLRGWGWMPKTASWVEPTAYALVLLSNIPGKFYPAGASKRRQLGERMLYDRVCPGGGWNAGNPMVYGVAGEPRVSPTAWALLALRDYPDRPENRASLDWLEQNYEHISGPGSLALAHLCLKAYGRPAEGLETKIRGLYLENHFLGNVAVAAWVQLALGNVPPWLGSWSRTEMKA